MMETIDTIIKTEGVTKYYNRSKPNEVLAVDNVSLEVKKGDFAVLKGPSGSGKTTLLSLLGCMSRPSSGSILVQGKDITHLPEKFLAGIRRSFFGFIFQQFHLIQGMSVLQNVMMPLYPTGIALDELRATAEAALGSIGMTKRGDFGVQQLSGGEQQRTAIARALINDPAVVLADEPTAHLDSVLSKEFMSIMDRLREKGKTVIIASHDPIVYESKEVDLLVEMRDGRITNISGKS